MNCTMMRGSTNIKFCNRFEVLTAVFLSVETLLYMTLCHWKNS